MNIQEMKQRVVELELLERQQMNGAVIEFRIHENKWAGHRGKLLSNFEYRIKRPPEQPGFEWCGYDEPTLENCDCIITAHGYIMDVDNAYIRKEVNNGYRHLLRRVDPEMMICNQVASCGAPKGYCKHAEPHACKDEEAYFRCMGSGGEGTKCIPYVEQIKTIPYTLDTFVLKSSHVWIPVDNRLPEDMAPVLVSDGDNGFAVAWYRCNNHGNGWFPSEIMLDAQNYDGGADIVIYGDIKYWMPIPPVEVT